MKWLRLRNLLALIFIIVMVMLGACTSNSTPTTTSTQPPATTPVSTPTTTGAPVTINLTAQSMSFDKKTISVQAGAKVTLIFDNKDSVTHNFALYTDSSAATVIFRGETITGPKTITYQFTAPSSAGNYFFRCDVHPTAMTGTFTVQ